MQTYSVSHMYETEGGLKKEILKNSIQIWIDFDVLTMLFNNEAGAWLAKNYTKNFEECF